MKIFRNMINNTWENTILSLARNIFLLFYTFRLVLPDFRHLHLTFISKVSVFILGKVFWLGAARHFEVILLNTCSMKEGKIWKKEFQTTQAVFWKFSGLKNNDWLVGRKPAVVLWYCSSILCIWELEYKREESLGRAKKGF